MGKSVLILGGSSDISIALAHKLASDGYDIQLVVRNITAIKRIESDIELRYRVNVNSFYFDVLDMDSIDLFLDKLPCLPVIVISAVGFLEREISIKDDVEHLFRIDLPKTSKLTSVYRLENGKRQKVRTHFDDNLYFKARAGSYIINQ